MRVVGDDGERALGGDGLALSTDVKPSSRAPPAGATIVTIKSGSSELP
jgi:hypothetical protein